MARPKKEGLSPLVGTVNLGRKRGNPDFVSSSFYVPRSVNIGFDRALLTLKDYGFDLDRSDVLSVLMDRFANAVKDAEGQQDAEGLDLDAILSAAQEGSVVETAGLTYLKLQYQKMIQNHADLSAEWQRAEEQLRQDEAEKDRVTAQLISVLLAGIPDSDLRQQIATQFGLEEASA